MKIITISIANRVDRPPEGGGQISLDPVEVGPQRLEGRTNRSRSETRPRPIQFARGWAGHGGARQGAPPAPPTVNTENRGSTKGWLRPMKRREASRTQRWIENYCSHGLHANWIIKFSASVVSPSAYPRPLSPYFAHGSFLRPTDDPPNRLSMLRARTSGCAL